MSRYCYLCNIGIVDVEHSHVRFLGNLALNLWDCGGFVFNTSTYIVSLGIMQHIQPVMVLLQLISFSQEAFMENYFSSQIDHIFRNVAVLIYVFDVESRELEVKNSFHLPKLLKERLDVLPLLFGCYSREQQGCKSILFDP